MRIVLIGQAAFGKEVLDALIQKGEQVVAVFAPPDKPGTKIDLLKEAANQGNIRVLQPPRMRDPEVQRKFAELAPDLTVMAFVTDIVPFSIINASGKGAIQYHPSLLPRHRGGSAINWAIIKGESKTGITIFWPDAGIDTGPILLQREVDISPDDTVGSLYYDKLFPIGVKALMEAIDLIIRGKAPRRPQDESRATYEGLCQEKDAIIHWDEPISTVYNLIRGTNPQPGATTSIRGERLKIYDCAPIKRSISAPPGQIIEMSDKGTVVAGQGGDLLIKRVQQKGKPKINAAEYALSVNLRVGERFN
jgi:methionyl-tRNA formyltransferase